MEIIHKLYFNSRMQRKGNKEKNKKSYFQHSEKIVCFTYVCPLFVYFPNAFSENLKKILLKK